MEGRILIADDLVNNRILLRARLRSAQYEVLITPSRGEALIEAARARPDLVIVDFGAPSEAALALLRALKSDPATAGCAVFALLTRPNPALLRAALEAGADDALTRSDDHGPLLARIRRLMRLRNRDSELGLREDTRAALGFCEAAAAFEGQATVAIVTAQAETGEAWRAAIAPHLRDRVVVLKPGALHGDGSPGATAPDVYVIATEGTARHGGLGLISELRSRARSRSAGVIAVTAQGDGAAQANALDLGADDVMSAPLDPQELVLRLRAQLRLKARADRLRRQVSDGLRLAVTDPLTGLSNRRAALARLGRIAERAEASGRPFAVMLLDLDRFKRVNDDWGHGAGDAVLVEAARRLTGSLRSEDLVARLGGEEFLVAMPDTGASEAAGAAERLRRSIESAPFPLPGTDRALGITVSIGVAISEPPAGGDAIEALVDSADRALYAAKAEGRNQVAFGEARN